MRLLLASVALAALGLSASTATQTRVERYGLRVDLPPGWHGRIHVREGGAAADLIAATVPLAPRDDDYGSRIRPRMRAGDVLILLWEYEPPASAIKRWRAGFPQARIPIRVRPPDLTSMEGIGTAVNRSLRFAGRYFQLVIVFGRRKPSAADFARANRGLAGLRISAMSHRARERLRAEKTRLRLRIGRGLPAGFERVVSLAGFGDFLWRCTPGRIDTAYVPSPGPAARVHAQTPWRRGDATVRAGERVVVRAPARWRVVRGRKAIVQISRWKGCKPWVDAFVRPLRVR